MTSLEIDDVTKQEMVSLGTDDSPHNLKLYRHLHLQTGRNTIHILCLTLTRTWLMTSAPGITSLTISVILQPKPDPVPTRGSVKVT